MPAQSSFASFSPFMLALAFLWFVGFIVTLAGASAIDDKYGVLVMGGGLLWFVLALDFATLVAFVCLSMQGRVALYRMSLMAMLIIITVFFMVIAQGLAPSAGLIAPGFDCYLAGLIISLIVNFALLLVLGAEPNTMFADFAMTKMRGNNVAAAPHANNANVAAAPANTTTSPV